MVDIGIELQCDKLIVATGGMAAPKTGSTGLGYPLAEQFGHTIVETKPALTALITEKDLLNKAAGVRTTAIYGLKIVPGKKAEILMRLINILKQGNYRLQIMAYPEYLFLT
mgnify:FL=1